MKNCPNCNAELADDAMFCNSCGQSINAAPANETLDAAQTKAKNEQTGKLVVFGAIGLVAIIAIVAIVLIISAGAYKKPVNKYISLINSKSTNVDAFADLTTPDFERKYDKAVEDVKCSTSKDYKEEMADLRKERMETSYEALENYYGDKVKIKVVRFESEKMKKGDLKEYKESYKEFAKYQNDKNTPDSAKYNNSEYYDQLSKYFEDEYDEAFKEGDIKKLTKAGEEYIKACNGVDVKAGYKVNVKLEVKGSDDEGTVKMEFIVIQVNGKWIIADVDVTEGEFL